MKPILPKLNRWQTREEYINDLVKYNPWCFLPLGVKKRWWHLFKLQHPLTLILIFICSPLLAQSIWWEGTYNGKYYPGKYYSVNNLCCNSPKCGMRQDILTQIQAQLTIPAPTASPTPQVSYTTRQVPYTYQVRVCKGRYCVWETRTGYRTEQVPTQQSSPTPTQQTVPPPTPSPTSHPQQSAPTPSPQVAQAPTPYEEIPNILPLLAPEKGQVVGDLGCGNGRILVTVTQVFNCKTVGIELEPELVKEAQASIDSLGLTDKIRVYEGDILIYDLSKLDIVYMYLYPDLMKQILPKLKPGTKVVSYLHELPNSTQHGDFYVWTKP